MDKRAQIIERIAEMRDRRRDEDLAAIISAAGVGQRAGDGPGSSKGAERKLADIRASAERRREVHRLLAGIQPRGDSGSGENLRDDVDDTGSRLSLLSGVCFRLLVNRLVQSVRGKLHV